MQWYRKSIPRSTKVESVKSYEKIFDVDFIHFAKSISHAMLTTSPLRLVSSKKGLTRAHAKFQSQSGVKLFTAGPIVVVVYFDETRDSFSRVPCWQ